MAEVEGLLGQYKAEQDALMETILEIMWHMRGSISREEAWTLSWGERKKILTMIEARIKLTGKHKMPLM